jgi:UDP-glucose 4-epimerase
MKIVITGSESFIGKELQKHCRSHGIEVVGIDLVPGAAPDYFQMDIRSPDIQRAIPDGADALIHLAAVSRDQDCRRDLAAAFDVNIGGTINLIRAAQEKKVKQFIFASSEWVYGNAAEGEIQTEEDPIDVTKMTSEYAMSKIIGERLLFVHHQRGLCPVTVLRFGIVYGPRPKPMTPLEGIFNEVRTLDKLEIKGSLRSGRRFIHVADVAEGIISALGRNGFEIFNLSGDRVITFGEIIETSAGLLKRCPEVVATNPHVINVRNPDNNKAKAVLHWQPRVDLKSGLKTLMESK